MRSNPVDKNQIATEVAPLREYFTKSVVARMDLAAGTVLHSGHLAVKKPGTGIPATRLPELLGRTLCYSVRANQLLKESDVA
jgi:N,N'-diacetyllegionaminate synthase